jgi:hypothetical protein
MVIKLHPMESKDVKTYNLSWDSVEPPKKPGRCIIIIIYNIYTVYIYNTTLLRIIIIMVYNGHSLEILLAGDVREIWRIFCEI